MRQIVTLKLPIREVNGSQWAELSAFGKKHIFVGTHHNWYDNFPFIDGHRVRKVSLEDKVHWLMTPSIMVFDISDVDQSPAAGQLPVFRKTPPTRKHHKG